MTKEAEDYLKGIVEEFEPLQYDESDLTTWEKAILEDYGDDLELTPTDMIAHRLDSPLEPDANEPVAACAGNSICVRMQTSEGRLLHAPAISPKHIKLLLKEYVFGNGKDNCAE